MTKNPKIKEIQQVQQMIYTKHISMLEITSFHVLLHLNLKRLRFTGEPMTRQTHRSHVNVIYMRT